MSENRFAIIVIDAINPVAIRRLLRTFTDLQSDSEVRAVILTGADEQAFSGGADLEELSDLAALLEGKPVIAAVNGLVSGGGLEIVAACAWRIAAANSMFRIPELASPVAAEEALRIGLIDRLAGEGGELMRVCEELARQIGRNAPLAVKYALAAVNRGSKLSLTDGLQLESSLFASCFATADYEEGVKAFLERREPDFRGE
jgi:enoyl-CoA hydratase